MGYVQFGNILFGTAVQHNPFVIVMRIKEVETGFFVSTPYTKFMVLAIGRSAKQFILPVYPRLISVQTLQICKCAVVT